MIKSRWTLFFAMCILVEFNSIFFVCASKFRDPFYLPTISYDIKKVEKIQLLGIVKNSDVCSAIVFVDGTEETIFVGDSIAGFRVNQIQTDCVILEKGVKKKTLFIAE